MTAAEQHIELVKHLRSRIDELDETTSPKQIALEMKANFRTPHISHSVAVDYSPDEGGKVDFDSFDKTAMKPTDADKLFAILANKHATFNPVDLNFDEPVNSPDYTMPNVEGGGLDEADYQQIGAEPQEVSQTDRPRFIHEQVHPEANKPLMRTHPDNDKQEIARARYLVAEKLRKWGLGEIV